MTFYEGMFLLDPADAAQDWEGVKHHVTDMIARCGGEVLYTEQWPDRKLAYEIKGRRKGTYLLTYFQAAGDAIAPLRRESRLSDRVVRLLIVKNERAMEEIEDRREAQRTGAVLAPAEPEVVGPPAGDEAMDEFGPEEAAAAAEPEEVEVGPEEAEGEAVEPEEEQREEGEEATSEEEEFVEGGDVDLDGGEVGPEEGSPGVDEEDEAEKERAG